MVGALLGYLYYRYYKKPMEESIEIPASLLFHAVLAEFGQRLNRPVHTLDKEQLEELVDQFIGVMITLELVFAEVFRGETIDIDESSVDDESADSTETLSILEKQGILSKKQVKNLLDAMSITLYVMENPEWIETYPDHSPFVQESLEKMPAYYEVLQVVLKAAEEQEEIW